MSKKGKFYILNWIFSYGSASSNRLLAYANSAAELGYDVEIVAFLRLDLRNCQPRNGVIIRDSGLVKWRVKFSQNFYLSSPRFGSCLQM